MSPTVRATICAVPSTRASYSVNSAGSRRHYSCEGGIERTVRWYLDNQEWLDSVTSGDYQSYYEQMYANR